MKILHTADTHLGYSAYNQLDTETGMNQRELDVYNRFSEFCDYAVNNKPDLILHSGDLFDSVRPSNRAIAACLDQLIRLSKAQIPVVLISGNHSTPRLRETGSVFRLLEHLEHIYPIYKARYEVLRLEELPGLAIHAVPHIGSEEQLNEEMEKFQPSSDAELNIGMLHGAIVGVREFSSYEFNEQMIASGYLKEGFDYIALGHYHEYIKVEENAYYAGSPERFSFNEASHKRKGFIELELEQGMRELKFIELAAREMIDIPGINCAELTTESVTDAVVKAIEKTGPEGKILRLKLESLSTGDYHTMDFARIRKAWKDAVHFEQINNVKRDDLVFSQGESPKINKLSTEFTEFLKGYPVEDLDKNKLKELGLNYISKEEG
jgi:DNA repair exonuclease SbcCD nuclease subunit